LKLFIGESIFLTRNGLFNVRYAYGETMIFLLVTLVACFPEFPFGLENSFPEDHNGDGRDDILIGGSCSTDCGEASGGNSE